jgi:hypothetical protein
MNQALLPEIVQVVPTAYATGLFGDALCTIQMPDGTLGATGAPSGNYIDVEGLVAIACLDAPPSPNKIAATEMKALEEIAANAPRHILLNGYFEQLDAPSGVPDGWIAVIERPIGSTPVLFDLLGAESDSQCQMTRLDVRLLLV